MPFKDSEMRKEYAKLYREKNKEKMREQAKIRYQKNKEQLKINTQKYQQSDKGKKQSRISNWKKRGVIGDYEIMYERYLNNEKCENCNCEYTEKNWKCLDHCHITGDFRNILCNTCNSRRRS